MKHGLARSGQLRAGLTRLCGAGALVLPLSVWAAPVVEDLSAQPGSFYDQTEARKEAGGSLVLFNQVQENQQELQRLRGQIEELRHQLDQMRKLSQERYLDLEDRLMAATELGGASPGEEGEGADTGEAAPQAAPSSSDEAQRAYQEAFQKVQARDFPAAISAFEAFVEQHPDTDLTANGYYWLGELHSAEANLDDAATAFQRVIADFPESGKRPDALYKLGLLRARQGQPEKSRELLERVREEHPDSNAAGLANDFLNQSGG